MLQDRCWQNPLPAVAAASVSLSFFRLQRVMERAIRFSIGNTKMASTWSLMTGTCDGGSDKDGHAETRGQTRVTSSHWPQGWSPFRFRLFFGSGWGRVGLSRGGSLLGPGPTYLSAPYCPLWSLLLLRPTSSLCSETLSHLGPSLASLSIS